MVGDLIMLPVRVGVRATQLWLRAAEETISVAANATSRVVGLAASRSGGGNGATTPPWEAGPSSEAEPASSGTVSTVERPGDAEDEEDIIAAAEAAVAQSEPVAAPESPHPAEPEPVHVSEEPTLVEELAEPGAEDGAGAEIHINEPWDGYARMSAKEIVARLGQSTPAELAAVQLYESSQRQRQTILNAVQRELRQANGRGD